MFKQGKRTSKQTHSYTIISKTWFLTTLLAMIFPKQNKKTLHNNLYTIDKAKQKEQGEVEETTAMMS